MITVKASDALRSETLTPGWTTGKCTGYNQAVAATDGSAVHKFEIEVAIPGIPIPVPLSEYVISEKATGMGKNFFIACGFPKEEWNKMVQGEVASQQVDPNSCIGKEFRVFVTNEKFGNRVMNKAGDFLPL